MFIVDVNLIVVVPALAVTFILRDTTLLIHEQQLRRALYE